MANDSPPPSSATINVRNASDSESAANAPVTLTGAPGQRYTGGPAPAPTETQKTFGRYQLQRLLGQGGMGAVYLAQDTVLHRTVALKLPRFAPDDPDMRVRFLREARSAAVLSHPAICPVFDVGEVDGQPYLTMAYIEGASLAQQLREHGPLPPRAAAMLVRTVARGMQDAHQQSILHRDLKPSNIQMNARGEPVVMDFGLALRYDAPANERLTQHGWVLGTPMYMPPEQIRGEALGPAADVYSLGVVLYELLTGRVPFQGTFGQVLTQVECNPPPALDKLCPGLDPALEAICLKALAKQPEDRFASMHAFAEALDDYLDGATLVAPVPRSRLPRGHFPRRRWAVAAALVVVLLGCSAGTWWLFGKTRDGKVYLSEMEPVEIVDWLREPPGPPPDEEPKGPPKGPPPGMFPGVLVKGKRSMHGIFMHPPPLPEGGSSKVGYSLGKRFRTFEAEVSLNDLPFRKGDWQCETPVTFSVYGDGQLLWKSRPVSSQADAQRCAVSVAGVDVLTIEVDCPGPPRDAHAVWIEPHVER
jgi:serine/threonine protein kinase